MPFLGRADCRPIMYTERKYTMWIADNWKDYEIIDCSKGEKLERWGDYILVRPDPQVIWDTPRTDRGWTHRNGHYHRSRKGGGDWEFFDLPKQWQIHYRDLTFNLKPFSFKHTGLFPEQAANWDWFSEKIRRTGRPVKVLNLFAYTGGATLAARAGGADVTHVDSVKPVVTWARENMELSGLDGVRWMVEDALKFVERELRRGSRYRGIVLDPPAYGRGANGEKWILEEHIGRMLAGCARLLEPTGAFLVLNLYSMGLSSTLARTAVHQAFGTPPREQYGELCFTDSFGKTLPLGTYYRFVR